MNTRNHSHLWTKARRSIGGLGFLLFAFAAFGQSDRGTLTGLISDPASAVVPNAAVEVRNTETGTIFRGGASATGNYVISMPAGKYEISVTAPGFKKYVRPNIEIRAAQTTGVDVSLEVGSLTETVTVSEAAPILKTESGELSHTVTHDEAVNLPVLTMQGGGPAGAGRTGNIRNPLAESLLIPGVAFLNDQALVVNGLPSSSETIRIEGQESSGTIWKVGQQQTQGGVDAIQEVAIQTSNFAAEFGQAAGGYFNLTMKSGTNQLHGGAYDYLGNEGLNAGLPFTDRATQSPLKAGQHIRNRVRRNDYGFTIGGPIAIPKLYNGKDRSFFFFQLEQFREGQAIGSDIRTVPTPAYRNGDFTNSTCASFNSLSGTCSTTPGALLLNGAPVIDPAGRTLLYGGIYDPATTRTVNGSVIRDLFPNNQVPLNRMDPVALSIQKLLPLPNNAGLINNYTVPGYTNFIHTTNYSFKLDHSLSPTRKISGYYGKTRTFNPNHNGLTEDFSGVVPTENINHTIRLNYDESIRPTLLLHVGIGFFHTHQPTVPPDYDAAGKLGLKGYYANFFPTLNGLNSTSSAATLNPAGGYGGLNNAAGQIGPNFKAEIWEQKPTANVNLTWVKDNHTFKAGGEYTGEGYPVRSGWRANGSFTFAADQTANPYQNTVAGISLPSATGTGFAYASYLLGAPQNMSLSPPTSTRLGGHTVGFFIQDNWKVTRKLTVDYGLRYDFATYLKEQYGRMRTTSFTTPNLNAGGRPGAIIYEGNGPGRCNCAFAHNYKNAFGPRLGFAYQIDSKTVLRGGAGIQYGIPQTPAGVSYSAADYYQINAPGFGIGPLDNTGGLAGGNPYATGNPYGNAPLVWPNFDNSKFPVASGILRPPTGGELFIFQDNQSRPGRIFTYSLGVQRQVLTNVVLEASYVGNRGAWFAAPLLADVAANALTPAALRNLGIDLNSATDRALLTSQISSAAVQADPRFRNLSALSQTNIIPTGVANGVYPGFPGGQQLVQALRPVPQFGTAPTAFLGPPKGTTWYDSVQLKATKRFSHGLQLQGSYVFSKGLVNGTSNDSTNFLFFNPVINDIFNRDVNKQLNQYVRPHAVVISGSYTTPGLAGAAGAMRVVSEVVRGWQVGVLLRYQSGALIQTPPSNNGLNAQLARGGTATLMNRNPGVNPFLFDPNCHCFDPQQAQVLNAAAWTDAAPGAFGTSAPFSNDYRWQRQPAESMNFGRNFRFGKENRMNFFIRAEFTNVFNRLFLSSPATTAGNLPNIAGQTAIRQANGINTGGFGTLATINGVGAQPRNGQIVARFQF